MSFQVLGAIGFAAIAWLVVCVNFAAAILVLLRPWRKRADPARSLPITLADAALAALAAAGLLIAERVAGIGRNPFGLIRLVYLHLVVLAPATGLTVLALSLWRKGGRRPYAVSRPVKILAALTLAAIPVGVYATFIEPFRLKLETAHVALRDGRDAGGEIRIAVLADIQTDRVGEHERRAIDLAMAQQPDIIFLPGDLWQSDHEPTPEETAALRDLLDRLSAPGGVWFAAGNCDSPVWIRKLLAGTPVALLDNDITQVQIKGRKVTIGGVELNHTREVAAVIRQLEENAAPGDIRILLGHYPDNALHLKPDSRIDLVVAGHTHGGQIVIPGLGPLMTLSRVPRHVAAGGLHRLNGNALYVSRGVGCERNKAPRIRFFCPPEVSLLTIGGNTARGLRCSANSGGAPGSRALARLYHVEDDRSAELETRVHTFKDRIFDINAPACNSQAFGHKPGQTLPIIRSYVPCAAFEVRVCHGPVRIQRRPDASMTPAARSNNDRHQHHQCAFHLLASL